MVGDQINYANNGIKDEAGKRLFNLLNCLLLAEKRPATLNMLEAAYLEVILTNIQNIHCSADIHNISDIQMEGSEVPHLKFGFPGRLQLLSAWFDLAWFRLAI